MHPLLLAVKLFYLLIFYDFFFVVTFLSTDSLADCPYALNFFNFPNSSISGLSTWRNHTFINQTKQCYDDLNESISQTQQIGPCSPGNIEVSLNPYSVLPVGTNISPHATLNILVTAFVPVSRLFIQFRCLHAPDAEDVYCHDHGSQIAMWGKMIWPCRELQLDNYSDTSLPENLAIPFRLNYNCFRLFSLSHYEVNITTWPKPCRMSFIATIPVIQHLEPKVREYIDFKQDEKLPPSAQPNWSPLLYVDVSSTDGVWIRFEPSTWISQTFHNYISIVIFERSSTDRRTHMLLTKKIGPSHNGFRWENVAAGEYFIYAFVEKIDCQLSCETSSADENSGLTAGCKICPHTSINFTLTEDRFTLEWRKSIKFMGIAKAIGIGIFVTLVVIVIGLLAVLFYLRVWHPRQLARLPPESIELTAKPTVLLLYTDDCEEHSNAVMALANLLTHSANAKVMIDQSDLLDPSIRPSVWLLNSVAEAEFILIMFSEGSKQVMNGQTLSQRRPFPDLFNTALGYVAAKINDLTCASVSSNLNRRPLLTNGNSTNAGTSSSLLNMEKGRSQLSRFIVARFTYSSEDVIPEFFAHERFGKFVIPEDIGLLIGRVHGVLANRLSNFEHTADLESLNSTIETFKNFTRENSNWLEHRLESGTSTSFDQEEQEGMENTNQKRKHQLADHLERLPSRRVNKIPTLEEQALLADKFGLLKPDELNNVAIYAQESGIEPSQTSSTSDEPKKFQLVGKLEDFCSSSSSLSSKESNYDDLTFDLRGMYSCSKCPKTFPWPRNLRKHIENMHSKKHKCSEPDCNEVFDIQHQLRRHMSVEHPKMKTCQYCTYKHRKPAMVRRHEEQFHGEKAVSCSVKGCGLAMPYNQIKNHVQEKHSDLLDPVKATTSNNDVMPFECPKCKKKKFTRSQLRRHIASVHEKRYTPKKEYGKPYACPEDGCKYSFKTPGELQDHLNTLVHRSEYPFECGHCAKKFSQRSLYAIHLRKYHAISIKTVIKALGKLNSQVFKVEEDGSQFGRKEQEESFKTDLEGQENMLLS